MLEVDFGLLLFACFATITNVQSSYSEKSF